jgi:hypothetical protein
VARVAAAQPISYLVAGNSILHFAGCGVHTFLRRLVFVLGLAVAFPLWAQSPSGLYGGLGLDFSRITPMRDSIISTLGLPSTTKIDGDSFNLALYGGYRFDDFFALQAELSSGGTVRATNAGQTTELFDVSMFTISARLSLLQSERMTMYGKLGGTFWAFTEGSGSSALTLNDGFGPSLGAGLDINLYGGGERRLRLEWTHHRFDGVLVKSANSFTIGAVFFR